MVIKVTAVGSLTLEDPYRFHKGCDAGLQPGRRNSEHSKPQFIEECGWKGGDSPTRPEKKQELNKDQEEPT
jgi:hypothetical protein